MIKINTDHHHDVSESSFYRWVSDHWEKICCLLMIAVGITAMISLVRYYVSTH